MATLTITASILITLIAGILILAWPKMFRILLGFYLILIAVVNMIGVQ